MADLISREAFIKSLCNSCDGWCENTNCDCLNCNSEHRCDFIIALADVLAIDAVEVVRCEDCDVPHNKWTGCPMLNGLVTPPDFYCGFGERREENDGKTICGTGSL